MTNLANAQDKTKNEAKAPSAINPFIQDKIFKKLIYNNPTSGTFYNLRRGGYNLRTSSTGLHGANQRSQRKLGLKKRRKNNPRLRG